MPAAFQNPLRERSLLRYALYTVGLVALFGYLFDQDWQQVAIVTSVLLVAEHVDISRALGSVDPRYVQLAFGLVPLGAGLTKLLGRADVGTAAVGIAVGGWIALDACYSLRAGITPSSADDPGVDDPFLLLSVANLVTDELASEPKTVPELAAACDMTESRVRDAVTMLERNGTVHREGDRWVLDESRLGLWAFVRDNTRRVLGRLFRPFRLFVPS